MIAISLLTVGFLGIFSLLSRSLFLNRVIANETTATYLAAEGVELAKNLIDHDVYSGLAATGQPIWGAAGCFGGNGTYQLDYTATVCPPPLFNAGVPLKFDPATHLYGYAGSVTSPFTRRIRITTPNPNEIVVGVTVMWSTGPIVTQSINVEDHFYNWHP